MSKLGYTFYPKDWQTDDAIFQLSLEERGLFRELIDLAMLNDNTTVINYSVWCRKFNAEYVEDLITIVSRLKGLKLIEVVDNDLFIPSCEKRLKLIRAGRKGGKKTPTKPKKTTTTKKTITKVTPAPTAEQKPLLVKQREIKIKNKVLLQNCIENKNWLNLISKNNNLTIDKLKSQLIKFENDLKLKDDEKGDMKEFKRHFVNWLNKQPSSTWQKPNYF